VQSISVFWALECLFEVHEGLESALELLRTAGIDTERLPTHEPSLQWCLYDRFRMTSGPGGQLAQRVGGCSR
jgi:hypothetical protein